MIAHGVPGLDIQQNHPLAAPPSAVFAALTVQVDAWWPVSHRLVGGRLALAPELGASLHESGPQGAGAIWGIVDLIEPDRRLYLSGWFGVPGVVMGRVQFDLNPEGPGTRLGLLHQAIGPVSEDRVSVHRSRWREILGTALARHLSGTPV